MFHHNTAKLLFLCKRARPDVQTAVAFLSTRVKGPDRDDYKKLSRVMKYLRGTVNMPLTLEADSTHIVKWWVDPPDEHQACQTEAHRKAGRTLSEPRGPPQCH